ncbi:hypothetical protein Fsol_00363 [Candidatus Fokinia solitaria]|uniref:Uncharacterized protein n=1 Tax=Candidatus Fokinia solitaria TaxID=1802984 RepID=A0A2U8BS44_9RICK|nr:hypothetical protein [Candidatus Fokinia solitaria]AWD33161.1 hypothetical protein Fsol_00363 [Candidatus Fokinia solitaria]
MKPSNDKQDQITAEQTEMNLYNRRKEEILNNIDAQQLNAKHETFSGIKAQFVFALDRESYKSILDAPYSETQLNAIVDSKLVYTELLKITETKDIAAELERNKTNFRDATKEFIDRKFFQELCEKNT